MERIVILAILVALLVLHLFVVYKVAFLGFYYLPILLAGFFCGKRTALLLSILSVFLITLYSLVEPGKMSPAIAQKQEQLQKAPPDKQAHQVIEEQIGREKFKLYFSLIAWGGFLILAAIASSTLYEQKQRRVRDLRRAYVGVLEILSKYLELADRYSVGRSVRVADLAEAVGQRLQLDQEVTENIHIAALLHDMGHKETSALILGKSAELGSSTAAKITTHSVSGQEVLRSVSSVLEGVVPIVNAYQEYFVGARRETAPGPVTTAAEIIAVARTYDDMVTGGPARKAKTSSEALAEIQASAGKEFDNQIVQALEEAVRAGAGQSEPGDSLPKA
jgi:HD-GYP domain-containing protein (c-di-GMP phosphodiesterase class II)